MLHLASNFKKYISASVCLLVSCASTPTQPTASSREPQRPRPKSSEIRIAPPPKPLEAEGSDEKIGKVLSGERRADADEIKLPVSVMGLEPGDLTRDPISQSREQARYQRTDAEILSSSGSGEFEKKLADFDRVLGVTEEENRPLAPSFTQSTKKIRELFAAKRFEDGLVEANELLLHYSKSALLWTMKGTLHLRLSQADLAMAAYEKAFDIEPNSQLLAQIEQLRRIVRERESLKQKSPNSESLKNKPGGERMP